MEDFFYILRTHRTKRNPSIYCLCFFTFSQTFKINVHAHYDEFRP